MRPAVALLTGCLTALLAGCASSSGGKASEMDRTGVSAQSVQLMGNTATTVRLADDVRSKKAIIDLPPDKAFTALEAAYGALGIPISQRDAGTRRLGNEALRVRRKVADLLMTKVVDCGGDSGMPNAETYTVTLSLFSQVTPNDAGGSVLQTVIEGAAKNPLTNAANAVRCSSVGGLEARIQSLVTGKEVKVK